MLAFEAEGQRRFDAGQPLRFGLGRLGRLRRCRCRRRSRRRLDAADVGAQLHDLGAQLLLLSLQNVESPECSTTNRPTNGDREIFER